MLQRLPLLVAAVCLLAAVPGLAQAAITLSAEAQAGEAARTITVPVALRMRLT